MHTLGLSTMYFLLPWNLGWLYNSHSGGVLTKSVLILAAWRMLTSECPNPSPAAPAPHYTKRSPKGSGVFSVEAEKPQGTLCRTAQGECSSFLFCMGPVGTRGGHAAQPKGFPPTCNTHRQTRFRASRCVWWLSPADVCINRTQVGAPWN